MLMVGVYLLRIQILVVGVPFGRSGRGSYPTRRQFPKTLLGKERIVLWWEWMHRLSVRLSCEEGMRSESLKQPTKRGFFSVTISKTRQTSSVINKVFSQNQIVSNQESHSQ
jgi:hypothetical protein